MRRARRPGAVINLFMARSADDSAHHRKPRTVRLPLLPAGRRRWASIAARNGTRRISRTRLKMG
jgi:hypothetical protein